MITHMPGFPADWHLRAAGISSNLEQNFYRNEDWRNAEAALKTRDWREDRTLNAMGQPIALRGDILHHIPIAERLAQWKSSRSVFPMSRPSLK